MNASPRLLVLLFVALHLQCLDTKYYLVNTDGKAASVHRKSVENTKNVVSSTKTSKATTKTGSAKRKHKKTARVRQKNIGIDYVGNQPYTNPGNPLKLPNANPGILPRPKPNLPPAPHRQGTFSQGEI